MCQDLEAAVDILKLLEKEKIDRHVLKVCAHEILHAAISSGVIVKHAH